MSPTTLQIWTAVVGIVNAALFVLMGVQLIWRLNHWERPQRIWFAVVAVVCAYFAGHLYTETFSAIAFRPVAVAVGAVWVVISAGLSAALLLVDVKRDQRIASLNGGSPWTFTTHSRETSPALSRNGARRTATKS